MKLGIQLWTVRTVLQKGEQEFRETFKTLKSLGYDEVQTAGCYGYEYGKYYDMIKEAGIDIVGTHDDFGMMVNDIEQSIENHKKLHTTNMGVGGFFAHTAEETEDFILKANKIAARISKEGMKFTYHHHNHEFMMLDNGKRMIDMLMEGLDPENITFVLDTYWLQYAGVDVCEWIEKLAGRVDILHLKDMACRLNSDGNTTPIISACGKGNMNFEKIIATAKNNGVKYLCVEQDNCPEDYIADVKASSEHLHKIIDKI